MIGTGVFTSLGFQLASVPSPFVILLLWALGGVAAFCGAVSYAELGAALPKSGGEYQFVSRIYHPAAGFISGWASVTVGFAAPTALAAMTFAAYATSAVSETASDAQRQAVACALIVALALVHGWRRKASGTFQTFVTVLKILVIVAFCGAAFVVGGEGDALTFLPQSGDARLTASSAFAVSLIYVSFAYTGWNVATYLTGEIENPQRNLPVILGLGTIIVAALYIGLNAAFLAAAPVEALSGQIEVGFIAARAMFGERAGDVTSLVMAGLLISTVSAMTIAGPRVWQAMGEDYPLFKGLQRKTMDGVPRRAIYLQSALAIAFVLSAQFETVLVLSGSLLAMNSFVTVFGLYVLRLKEPRLNRPYRVFAYPVAPAIYLALTGSALVFGLASRATEAAFILAVVLTGAVAYLAARQTQKR